MKCTPKVGHKTFGVHFYELVASSVAVYWTP